MNTIHLTAVELAELVSAVLPFAGKDDMLPTINAVLLETDGKWLYAMTTDRFRVGVKRIAKRPTEEDESTTWPEFRALVPLRSVKSMLTLFKPARHMMPTLSLTVENDQLVAEATGGFDLFTSSRFGYKVLVDDFPDIRAIVRKTLAEKSDQPPTMVGLNAKFLADYKHLGGRQAALEFTMGAREGQAVIIQDHDGFMGLLMPRRLMSADPADRESWDDFLAEKADPEPEPAAEPEKKAPARKRAAAKKPAAKKASVSA